MLLLAVDTSGKNGSLALATVAEGQSEQKGQSEREVSIYEIVPLAGGAFSAELVPRIATLLQRYGYNKNQIDAFAVASGPGSFTGLRVGLAAIKALAEALQKRIAAVSVLEAIASCGASPGPVVAALDAGRGDVYVGEYEFDHGAHMRMRSERLLSRDEFLSEAKAAPGINKVIITPNASLAETLRAAGEAIHSAVELIEYPTSAVIARLGWQHLQRGETVRPEDLEANYIRRSDAEIISKPTP